MITVAFDSETDLIAPGNHAPKAACWTWQVAGQPGQIIHAMDAEPLIRSWLESPDVLLVGHNVAYDMGVVCSNYPALLPLVFKVYEDNRVTDTMLRQKLLDIAGGCYRGKMGPDDRWIKLDYSLLSCVRRHTGRMLKKEGFRLFYGFFADVPLNEWPSHAAQFQQDVKSGKVVITNPDQAKEQAGMLAANPAEILSYPTEDAVGTLDVWLSQQQHKNYLEDEFRQARADWWLHLMSSWGLHTDAAAVHDLRIKTENAQQEVKSRLMEIGLVREDGSRDTKRAKEVMEEVCATKGITVRRTPAKQVCLDSDACEATEEPILEDYAGYSTLSKVLGTDIPMLLRGTTTPIHSHFGMAETGRTTSSSPNIQNLRRMPGIREVIRPRPGYVFAQADYDQLELRTLAQCCLHLLGQSTLAEILNRGHDPHLEVARVILGLTYEEAKANKKRQNVNDARQAGKVANFGFPGGLGVDRLVYFAKHTYNVDLTRAQAVELKDLWTATLPEMKDFFKLVNGLPSSERGRFMEQVYTKRFRANASFSAACIGYYQGLGADATKEAGWRVARACYNDPSSPLYGCRIVCYVHDEFIVEVPCERGHEAANELVRLMIEGARMYMTEVAITTEPILMTAWSKDAYAKYDENKRLVPWTLADQEETRRQEASS